MSKKTYKVIVKRAPVDGLEQPFHPNDSCHPGQPELDEALRAGQRLYSEAAAANDGVPQIAYVYEVGPRGCHLRRWTLDTSSSSWVWIGSTNQGRGWV